MNIYTKTKRAFFGAAAAALLATSHHAAAQEDASTPAKEARILDLHWDEPTFEIEQHKIVSAPAGFGGHQYSHESIGAYQRLNKIGENCSFGLTTHAGSEFITPQLSESTAMAGVAQKCDFGVGKAKGDIQLSIGGHTSSLDNAIEPAIRTTIRIPLSFDR